MRSTSDQAWIFLQPQMLCAKVFLIPLQFLFDLKNGGVNGRHYICSYALIDVVCRQYKLETVIRKKSSSRKKADIIIEKWTQNLERFIQQQQIE